MTNELKDLLRSVLKEELEPVHTRLDGMDKRFDKIEKRLDGVDKRLDGVDKRLDGMDKRLNGMDQQLNILSKDVLEIKTKQDGFQKNIIDSIGQYTEKIVDYVDDKTEALNKRLFNVETEIQRLTRQ
jgi:flagellar capping protein FliD